MAFPRCLQLLAGKYGKSLKDSGAIAARSQECAWALGCPRTWQAPYQTEEMLSRTPPECIVAFLAGPNCKPQQSDAEWVPCPYTMSASLQSASGSISATTRAALSLHCAEVSGQGVGLRNAYKSGQKQVWLHANILPLLGRCELRDQATQQLLLTNDFIITLPMWPGLQSSCT
jgi:hypothetical protein